MIGSGSRYDERGSSADQLPRIVSDAPGLGSRTTTEAAGAAQVAAVAVADDRHRRGQRLRPQRILGGVQARRQHTLE
jgi:hypothetical protein